MTEGVFLYSTTSPPFSQIPPTCAPAAGKSRTLFVPLPSRARTRLVPGARPRTAPVSRAGRKPAPAVSKSRGCAGQVARLRWASRAPGLCLHQAAHARGWFRARGCAGHTCGGQVARLRRASRAPCLFLPHVSHARVWFRVWAHTGLLFSRAGRKPGFCSLRPGKSPHLRWASRAPGLFFPASRTHARLRQASRAAAPGKSRTGFVPAPSRARTRLFPSACPRTAPVSRAGKKLRRVPHAQKRLKS